MSSSDVFQQTMVIEQAPYRSKTISRLSLLTAVVASQAYLIYTIFFAHALTPVSIYVIDRQTHRHLLSGQIGDLEEVFHWDGLLSTILISIFVFVACWMAVSGTAKLLASSRNHESRPPNPSRSTRSSCPGGLLNNCTQLEESSLDPAQQWSFLMAFDLFRHYAMGGLK